MDFGKLKEQFKDNEDFTSTLDQIESEFKTLSGKKETAVENEIKYRNAKQEIAKKLGLEENTPLNEVVGKIGETIDGYVREIDSFKSSASSKDLEVAKFSEDFSKMQDQLTALTEANKAKDAEIALSELKAKFGKALTAANIKDADAQELVFDASLAKAANVEDLNAFAKSIAESKPFLTATVHKPGAGSNGASREINNSTSVRDVDVTNKEERTSRINNRLAERGIN